MAIPTGPLADYPRPFLICRVTGHLWPSPDSWHWIELVTRSGRVVAYRLEMECERCTKTRTDRLDATEGTKKASYPRPPEGYAIPGGAGRGVMRLELIRRLAAERPERVEIELVEED